MPRKHSSKGRSKSGGRFVALPHFLMEGPAWRSLPAYERAALIEVAMIYDGSNNGYLDMGVRRLAGRINVSPNKASGCLRELVNRGFLEVTQASAFSRKDRTATSFRLTHHRCDRTHQAGSRAYQNWSPEAPEKKTTVARGEFTVARGGTVAPLQSQEVIL
ncbi:MAG TPA: hypothetical protein DCX75_10165 [Brevundimonas sp.]|nr:hypothetical protein [Brevundimonas sp.]